jgi:GntR family transcriptional regulator
VPDYSEQQPAYMQIAADIRDQINSGKIAPGERIPSQRALAEQYDVAGGTIRDALKELITEGVIGTQSTRGTIVLKVPGEPVTLEGLRQQVADLVDRVGVLEAHLADLYARTGFKRPQGNTAAGSSRRRRKSS